LQSLEEKTEKNIFSLRGHHLLCVYNFSGRGYNAIFINNMQRIVEACKSQSQLVRVVDGLDDICEFCPHCDGNLCQKDRGRVSIMDEAALAALGVDKEHTYTFFSLRRKIKDGIKNDMFQDICTKCSWFVPFCRQVMYSDPKKGDLQL